MIENERKPWLVEIDDQNALFSGGICLCTLSLRQMITQNYSTKI